MAVTRSREEALARAELIDGPSLHLPTLRSALDNVAWVTRWGGGFRALVRELEGAREWAPGTAPGSAPGSAAETAPGSAPGSGPAPASGSAPAARPLRLLDVGSGSGGLARSLASAASGPDRSWRAFGVDSHPDVIHLSAARTTADRPGPVRGDALALPFADGAFDAVLCNLTLHHFPHADAVRIVGEMARVSRGVVLVADLERRRAAYVGARLLAATVWRRNPLLRHDGPLSVLRGFTPDELRAIAIEAGLRGVEVRRTPVFRVLLTAHGMGRRPSR